MKSIKPGRGPSMMSGVMSIAMGLFGVIWIAVVAGMGGGFFALFGVIFVAVAIVQAVYHFKNAASRNRYSSFDIVDGSEEPDPLSEQFGAQPSREQKQQTALAVGFCPYCGTPAEQGYAYCAKCGKKLPPVK